MTGSLPSFHGSLKAGTQHKEQARKRNGDRFPSSEATSPSYSLSVTARDGQASPSPDFLVMVLNHQQGPSEAQLPWPVDVWLCESYSEAHTGSSAQRTLHSARHGTGERLRGNSEA